MVMEAVRDYDCDMEALGVRFVEKEGGSPRLALRRNIGIEDITGGTFLQWGGTSDDDDN